MNSEKDNLVLSSEDIKNLMLNMEKEQEMLDAARLPLLIMLTDLKNSTMYYDRLGDVAAKSIIFKHNNILFPIIEANQGTVIKTTGDGILAVFETANCGIEAAIGILQQLESYNRDRDPESTITIRIGLHYGKTIVYENDVYGDSINATARLEALADGNEIIISENVVQAATLQEDMLVNIGWVHLKGKLEPVNVYGLMWSQDLPELKQNYLAKKKLLQQSHHSPVNKLSISIDGLPEPEKQMSETHNHLGNPFLNRSAITLPEYFFGREVLIHKIYSRLSAQRPQSISIYGERRIGKSSLLNLLRSYKLRSQYLSDLSHYIFILIDIQSMRSATVEHFIQTLYDSIRRCFCGNISFELQPNYQDFTRLVDELSQAGFVMIIMFDEFDLITLNPNFDVEFYSWLRSLASHHQLAFITSSLTQLQHLCATKKISDSPFFNIFTAFYVNPFTPLEAAGMITGLVELSLSGYNFANWLPEVFDKAGYLPFFMQIYCSNLFDLYPAQPSTQEVEAAYLEEATDHFEHICRILDEQETECLLMLLNAKKIPPKLEGTLQALLRKGYVKQEDGKTQVFSSTFGTYLLHKLSAQPKPKLWSKLWKR